MTQAINDGDSGMDLKNWSANTTMSKQDILELTFQTLLHANARLSAPVRASLAGERMSVRDVILLRTLIFAGEATASELSNALLVTKGAVSQQLNKLESDGLVTRTRRARDRRVVHVQATTRARERFAKLHAATSGGLSEAFDGWQVKELQKLRQLLTRLTVDTK